MKRSRFTEEQIIEVLKGRKLGAKTADLCRKHGISEATFYAWKSKFGGMDVSEAKRQAVVHLTAGVPGDRGGADNCSLPLAVPGRCQAARRLAGEREARAPALLPGRPPNSP